MTRKSLAIFDFDGTLVDSAGWFSGVLNEVARRYGFRETGPEERALLRGRATREIVAALGVPAWKLPVIARHMRALASRDIESIRPFPWSAGILESLAGRGVRLAVVSSNAEANIRRALGPHCARIETYATGASLFGKAAKFKAVLKAAGTSPAAALAIGDEVRDIEAARSAGLDSLAVTWGYASRDALAAAGPTWIADTPDDLMRLFP